MHQYQFFRSTYFWVLTDAKYQNLCRLLYITGGKRGALYMLYGKKVNQQHVHVYISKTFLDFLWM